MITNLAYRHALEQLCSHVNKPSRTQQWQEFWTQATGNAYRSGHPLAALIHDPLLNLDQLWDVGNKLFGTLSMNIHHYNDDDYTVDPRQWTNSVLAGKILVAMKPTVPAVVPGQPRAEVD